MSLSDKIVRSLVAHSIEQSRAPKRWHISRFAMYKALEGALAGEDSIDRVVLSISRSSRLAAILGLHAARVEGASYPDYDIAALDKPDAAYDFLVADQVLEHVAGGPFAAFAESRRVVKPGGFVVHTTCMLNEVHQPPMDFWRFTPHGMRMLAERHGLEVVRLGAWGNRQAGEFIQQGFRRTRVPEDEGHPIYQLATVNDEKHPITTWLVARRPLQDTVQP